jgi:hypothetical protein
VALADSSALEARLGRVLTDGELARADALLADASALVIAYTRQTFAYVEDDSVVLRSDNGTILLPRSPVIDVTSVSALGCDGVSAMAVTGWCWDGLDTVSVGHWDSVVINMAESWLDRRGERTPTYRVVYSHGYVTIPGDVASVVCGMALRCITSPTMVSGLVQEVIGPYSYRLDKDTSGSIVRITDDDRRTLAPYRRTLAMLKL